MENGCDQTYNMCAKFGLEWVVDLKSILEQVFHYMGYSKS